MGKGYSLLHFASLDNDIVTENQLTEEDATLEALEAAQTMSQDQEEPVEDKEDSDDDISVQVVEPEPPSPGEANEAVRVLRDFILTFDTTGAREREFLRTLSSMEDRFLRIQAKRHRQSKLEEYFQT